MSEKEYKITNTKLYRHDELVKVGCHDCEGCSSCCEGMGNSIIIDPYDTYLLTINLGKNFSELVSESGEVEFHVENYLILPNLKMAGRAGKECCSFLSAEGRCKIHNFRPGLCRLFPLGRNYEYEKVDDEEKATLNYFLLEEACPKKNKTKMKVQRWLEVENIKEYEQFLIDWHNLTKNFRAELKEMDEDTRGQMNSIFLKLFYFTPYTKDNFFEEFYARRSKLV